MNTKNCILIRYFLVENLKYIYFFIQINILNISFENYLSIDKFEQVINCKELI